jgi:DNA polymerase III epsilon subunit-like protein
MSLISEAQFAVLDVETTGFAAKRADRIVEIAVLRLSADGAPQDEYVTLVNPGRDLGPTGVHGLSGRDVLDAPRFSDIVGDVLSRLDGAVIVGHNVRFDTSFLVSECDRAGHALPEFLLSARCCWLLPFSYLCKAGSFGTSASTLVSPLQLAIRPRPMLARRVVS